MKNRNKKKKQQINNRIQDWNKIIRKRILNKLTTLK